MSVFAQEHINQLSDWAKQQPSQYNQTPSGWVQGGLGAPTFVGDSTRMHGLAMAAAQQQQSKAAKEPAIYGRAEELLNHLAHVEQEVSKLDQRLNGPRTEKFSGENTPAPQSLGDLVAEACQRLAGLAGFVATINGKLG